MNQIYVVCKPCMNALGFPTLPFSNIPAAAYSDFPSALAYAQSIFAPNFLAQPNMTAKDLIFMITLTPSTSSSTAATITTPDATAPA